MRKPFPNATTRVIIQVGTWAIGSVIMVRSPNDWPIAFLLVAIVGSLIQVVRVKRFKKFYRKRWEIRFGKSSVKPPFFLFSWGTVFTSPIVAIGLFGLLLLSGEVPSTLFIWYLYIAFVLITLSPEIAPILNIYNVPRSSLQENAPRSNTD